jgi:hypothetical protein
LSCNPQGRREVVAQLLDYALALRDLPFHSLPPLPSSDKVPVADEDDLQESLVNGDFLLLIAGDALDHRAIRLGEAVLAQHVTSGWDLAMVDMNLYHRVSNDEYLLVPELRGTIEHETRQTMRVTIVGESPKARVEVERFTKSTPAPKSQGRPNPWTIEEACGVLSEEYRASALRIFNFFNSHPLVRVEGGRGPKMPTLSLYTRDTNELISTTWFESSKRQLSIGLRAPRLLELHDNTEGELLDRFTADSYVIKPEISNDGYLTVNLPWDVDEKALDRLVRLAVTK